MACFSQTTVLQRPAAGIAAEFEMTEVMAWIRFADACGKPCGKSCGKPAKAT
jgi:hypothetical protein